MIRTAASFNRR